MSISIECIICNGELFYISKITYNGGNMNWDLLIFAVEMLVIAIAISMCVFWTGSKIG